MTETPAVQPAKLIDPKMFWRTLGERATGMTIVTADSNCGPAGFLGLSAAHVTADPPTILVSVDHKTSALAAILSRRHFAVNFMPAHAEKITAAFSGKSGLSGAERFAPGEWGTLTAGAPVYLQALGVFDCSVEEVIQRGSVSIVIGRGVDAAASSFGDLLIFFRGKTRSGFNG